MPSTSLRRAFQSRTDHPLRILAGSWALAMLTPFLLRTPMPDMILPLMRQDFLLAVLLTLTFALIVNGHYSQNPPVAYTLPDLGPYERGALCALALFIAWSAVSALWAKNSSAALYYAVKWVGFTLFFVLMCRAVSRPFLLRLSLFSLAAAVTLVGLICLGDAWVTARTELPRLTGFGEPQAMAVPLFAALALRLRRRREALLCAAVAALAWAGMLQMWQRAALIATVASLAALALGSLLFRQHRPRSIGRAAALLAALALATLIQAAPSRLLHEGANPSIFARTAATVGGGNLATDQNTRVRILLWAVSLQMWGERPLTGAGADNFAAAYPEARRAFAAERAGSPLLADREDLTARRAHNEYLQMLAEVGAVGLLFFFIFCALLIAAAWRAVSRGRSPLPLGAACSLLAFALCSGASSASFRWFMSGLMFFFASAIVFHFAATPSRSGTHPPLPVNLHPYTLSHSQAVLVFSALALVFLFFTGRHGVVTAVRRAAESADDPARTERLYRNALALGAQDAETHYSYGVWLFTNRQHDEAAPHLRYAVEHGLNDAGTFSLLASAQTGAGDARAAAATLAYAESVFPRSLYLRVRHASTLAEGGMDDEARRKFAEADAFDPRAARGWWYLLNCGRRCASEAARADRERIALAGELTPQPLVELALFEAEIRPPTAAPGRQTITPPLTRK